MQNCNENCSKLTTEMAGVHLSKINFVEYIMGLNNEEVFQAFAWTI